MTPNRTTKLLGIVLVFVVAFLWFCFFVQAQTNLSFDSSNKFDIPVTNGAIRFAGNGTYEAAVLENATWSFQNVVLNSRSLAVLRISVQDSNITIFSYDLFNATVAGVRISYRVQGQGTQTFNFGSLPKDGEWSVRFNGEYVDAPVSWSAKSDGTITIIGAPNNCNVSVAYYTFVYVSEDSNQPFYVQHSVAVATGSAVAITFVVLVAIWRRNRSHDSEVTEQAREQYLTEKGA